MPRKKLPYTEGSLFAVPLRDKTGYAVGLAARLDGKGGVLGYFFKKKFTSPPMKDVVMQFKPNDAILVRQFGDLGLLRGTWPVIGQFDSWLREQWPVPFFARVAVDHSVAWRVVYSNHDGITPLADQEIPVWEAQSLPEDGLSGYGALELRLTELLKT